MTALTGNVVTQKDGADVGSRRSINFIVSPTGEARNITLTDDAVYNKVDIQFDNATETHSGLMSSADKTTVDNIPANLALKEDKANKDVSGGYVGLTLMKINFYNAARTFLSFFTNANTAARTYTFQNRDGTIADDTDLATKEDTANKSTSTSLGTSNTLFPTQNAVKSYVDAIVVGLLDDRGSYDASGNVFPSSGGSGTAGAILKGDLWYISVTGTLGTKVVEVGDSIRALTDTPGQTATNWDILSVGIGFIPENVANKDTDGTLAANSDTKYASQKASKTYADTKNTDTQTHAATSKATPVDNDEIPIVDSAASNVLKKFLWSNLKTTLWAALGAGIDSLTGKTTPVNADELVIADTENSNASKKLTLTNLKAFLKTYFDGLYTGVATIPLGTNTGGIALNATNTNPADVLAGDYDILGTKVSKTALTSVSLTTNVFLKGRQTLDASLLFRIIMDTSGTPYWLPAFGTAIASHTGNISGITGAGTTKTLTKSTGTIGSETGNIVVVNGTTAGAVDGVFLITGGNGSSTITFESSGTTSGTAGTYTIYNPALTTIHDWDPVYSSNYNQYVVDARGIPGSTNTATYRDLGIFRVDGSSHSILAVAWGQGSDKHNRRDGNDNWQTFTATLSAGYNASAQSFFWRRNGDGIDMKGLITIGATPTSADTAVSLPPGMPLDTGKLIATQVDNFGQALRLGTGAGSIAGTAYGPWPVIWKTGNNNLYIGQGGTSKTAFSIGLVSTLFPATDEVSIEARGVPVAWFAI